VTNALAYISMELITVVQVL